MAGYAPASLPHLSLVFDAATVGSVGDPWPLPHFALLQNDGVYTGTSETGVFTLSGQDAGLRPARKIIGAAGAFVLTGQDSTGTEGTYGSVEFPAPLPHLSLVLTGVAGVYGLSCAAGAFVVSGQDAALRKGVGITAGTGVFVLSGAPAERDMEMNGDVGTFTMTGQDAGLIVDRPDLIAETGTFILTGYAAGLNYEGADKTLSAFSGPFVLTGQDSTYTYTRSLQCDAGSFVLTGEDAGYETTGVFSVPLPSAGSSRPSRKRHYVEIDNQYFEVRDHDHAVEILTQLHEAAKEAAKAVKKAQNPPVMKIVKPDYRQDFVQDLQAQIDSANAQIAQMWREAEEAQRRAEDDADEEDVEALILAGVL